MLTFAEAIAREEGFGPEENRSTRNNNPGDIEWGKFAQAHGATHLEIIPAGFKTTPRFAFFPTVEQGWKAARDLLNVPAAFDAHGNLIHGYIGASIAQIITRWAPPSENNTESYINNVCQWTGFRETDKLTAEML